MPDSHPLATQAIAPSSTRAGQSPPRTHAGSPYERALREAAERDERVVVLTAENRAAIRNLPAALGNRFVDVGICEQSMIGIAAGLAMGGRRPVAHALATFLTLRAYEFIRDDLALPRLPTVLVGGVPGFLSEANGPTHQAIDDIAVMRTLPNMRVVAPADEDELAQALPVLLAEGAPCYVRHIGLPPAFPSPAPFELGRAAILSDGDDVGLLTYGLCAREAFVATEELRRRGHSVRLVHVRSLKPLDEDAVLATVRKCRAVFTIEDHLATGGLFSATAELCARRGVTGRLVPFALEERFFVPALLPVVLEVEGFAAARLVERIERSVGA
jgi:transketolase